MKNWMSLFCILSFIVPSAHADTPPSRWVFSQVYNGAGTQAIGNVSDALKVNFSNTTIGVTGTFFQAVQPVSQSGTWNVGLTGTLPAYASTPTFNLGTLNGAATNATLVTINSTLGSPFQAGGSIGNTAFGISGTLPAFASTPTVNLGTISTASTAANQVTAQSSLTSIDSKLTSPLTVTGPLTDTQLRATPVPVSGTLTATVTGVSTASNQTNGSQKTQVVDGAGAVVGPVQTLSGTNYAPVVLAASATSGAAVVARSVQVSGSDGTNAQTLSTDNTGKLNINNISGTITLPTLAATSTKQSDGTQKSQTVDASGNVQPSGDVLTRKIFVQNTDGSNNQSYTAASEAKVSVTQPIPAGTNLVGKVGIDQTTPGTTNGVQVNAALPAGSNIIGNVRIDQTTPGTTNAVQANAGTNLNTSLLALQSGANTFLDKNTSASLGALNAALTWTGNGIGAGLFSVSGTFGGTVLAEGTVDGITWTALSVAIGNGVSSSLGVTTAGTYRILSNSGFTQIRLRMSAYTSGSATVTFNGSAARSEQNLTMLDKSGSGTITALNGAVTATTNGTSTVLFNILGTWVATLLFEGQDGNGNWVATIGTVPGNGSPTASTGVNIALAVPSGGFNQVRVRASAFVSGTVNITYNAGEGIQTLQVFNLTPSALQTTATQTGTWTVQQGGTPTSVANAWPVKVTDGTNTGAVKAASTSAASTDPAQVVTISSNFPNLTGTTGTAVSVGVASTATAASNANRAGLILVNTSTARESCTVGTAVLNSGVTLFPGGTWTMDEHSFTTAAINCIAGAAASNISVQEFTK